MQTLITGLQTTGIICLVAAVALAFWRIAKHEDTPIEAFKHTIIIVGFGIVLVLISYGAEFIHNRTRVVPEELLDEYSFLTTEDYPFHVALRRL